MHRSYPPAARGGLTLRQEVERVDERHVLAFLDGARAEMVDFLRELVSVPSVNPPGDYVGITSFLTQRLSDLGLESEAIVVPPEEVARHGLETPRMNLIARLRGRWERPCLVFNPHLDTVPVTGQWTTDPFGGEIRNGRVYGRGAADNKGLIVAHAYALVALKQAGVTLGGTLVLAASVDEEIGGLLGTKFLLEGGYIQPDWAVVEGSRITSGR